MSHTIPEEDWKVFWKLRSIALERFCQRILDEIVRISADSTKTSYERYLEIDGLTRERNKTLARDLDDPRRSTMILQLAILRSMGLLEPKELLRFTAGTREIYRSLEARSVARPE